MTAQTSKSRDDFIFYRPDFERLTGCVKSALLLERIRFLFLNVKGGNEFYKFDAPCSHPKCNKNDTWADELNASRHQIGRLRRKIATEVKSGDSKTDLMQVEDEQGNLHPVNRIVLYWRDSYRKTTYWLNTELLKRHLSRIGSQLPQVGESESHIAGSKTAHTMSQDRAYHVAESHIAGSKTAHAMSQDRTSIDTEKTTESPSENTAEKQQQTHIAGAGGVDLSMSETGEFVPQGEPHEHINPEPHDVPLSPQKLALANVTWRGETLNIHGLTGDPDRYSPEDIEWLIEYALTSRTIKKPISYIADTINKGRPVPAKPEQKPDAFADFFNTDAPTGNIVDDMERAVFSAPEPPRPRHMSGPGRSFDIAYNQLEIQFDRASFDQWLKHMYFEDYDERTCTFTIAVKNSYALDMLQHRMYRNVQRVLSDAHGADVHIEFVLYDPRHHPAATPALAGGGV
ncbi:MAG: hypothetical protein AAF787_00090 [Chloroflexota bacterium]